MRKTVSTGSTWEPKVGYSRAVVVNDTIYLSGTAGQRPDVYAQTRDALAIVEKVLRDNGFAMSDVVQSRLVVADFEHWEDAARAHGEVYHQIKPTGLHETRGGSLRNQISSSDNRRATWTTRRIYKIWRPKSKPRPGRRGLFPLCSA